MNKINPFYLLGLVFMVTLFVGYKSSVAKEELKELNKEYLDYQKLAVELNGMKKLYGHSKLKEASLESFLQSFGKNTLTYTKNKENIKIKAKTLNVNDAKKLFKKLFNGSYNIVYIDILRLNDKELSVDLEIKW